MIRSLAVPSFIRAFGMIALLGLFGAGWAIAGGQGAQRHPASRVIFVTDNRCGADLEPAASKAEEGETREAVLKCLARGGHLMLHERSRDRLFTIEYESQDLVITMTNDFAGREAVVKGYWDDQKMKVVVQAVRPVPPANEVRMAPRNN